MWLFCFSRLLVLGCVMALLVSGPGGWAQGLEILSLSRGEGGRVEIRFEGAADSYYVLRRTEQVQLPLAPVNLARGVEGPHILTDPQPPVNAAFYRVEQIPLASPLDSDNDGLDDVYELERSTVLDPLDAGDAGDDPDGNGLSHLQEYLSARALTTIVSTSPSAGEAGVAVTRETVLRFSAPLAAAALLDTSRLYATYGGRRLLGRVELSSDRRQASLFYLENLPASARVRVTLEGDGLKDDRGRDVDADGDGQPGGRGTVDFETLSTSPLLGTAVIGHVFASEPQPDGLGGFVNRPLRGVTITVDGMEDVLRTTTDEQGFFRLSPAPAGRFFVHVDGRTAEGSDWPGGAYYPFIGKAWEAVAGTETNLAGGTGEIFLPLIAADALQPVSTTQDTSITFPPETLAANPALAGVEILVPANSLFADDGARGGRVGIAPVPPDRLPEPLPPGLELPLVITIQTDGPQNFDRPVPVRFPNLPDPVTGELKPPGASSILWSFSHDTGRWEPVAPMTVSADGKFVETDPGFGVLQPGWHGENPTSRRVKPPCPSLSWTEGLSLIKSISDCAADLSNLWKIFNTVISSISLLSDAVNLGKDTAQSIANGDYTAQTITDLVQRLTNAKRSALELADALNDVASPLSKAEALAKCLLGLLKSLTDITCNRADCLGSVVKWVCGYAQPAVNMANQFLGVIENARKGLTHGLVASFCASIETALESSKLLQSQMPQGGPARAARERLASLGEQEAARQLVAALQGMVEAGRFLEPARNDLAQVITAGQTLEQGVSEYTQVARAGARIAAHAAYRMTITPPGGTPQVQVGALSEVTGANWSARVGSSFQLEAFYPGFGLLAQAAGTFPDWRGLAGLSGPALELRRRELTEISYAGFQPAAPADADDEGVPDQIEALLGTDGNRSDTDRDGLTDLEEIREGRDPLAAAGAGVGLQARVALPGANVVDVTASGERAFAALDQAGLAVLAVPLGGEPTVLGRLPLPGRARRVAAEGDRVAVALGTAGLGLVNTADPAAARLEQQVLLDASVLCVTVADGVAYVGTSDGRIHAVHLATGARLGDWLWTPGVAVEDLALTGDVLLAVNGQGLSAWRLGEDLEPLGMLSLPGFAEGLGGLRRISVGGALAYVTVYEGFAAVDVSEPTALTLVGPVTPHGPNSFKQILPTGTGLGVAAVGTNPRDDGTHDVFLYNLGTPASTADFGAVFVTPGITYALALHQGRVLLADGPEGFAVLNPLARDGGTQPPEVSLRANFPLDPAEAEEGTLAALIADTRDDVMVRQVEFHLDGQLRATDAAYPFEFRFQVPALAASETGRFTLRVRAVDTGGNETWSDPLEVAIARDRTVPRGRPTPPTSAGFGANLVRLGVLFSEPMDAATLAPETFQVIGSGPDRRFGTADDAAVVGAVTYDAGDRVATLAFPESLPAGFYQAQLLARAADLAGNRLAEPIVWNFEALLGADSDGDGLTDEFELARGLNPQSADENQNGLPDATEDFDNDGLSNGIEMLLGTDPRNPRSVDNVPDAQRDQDGDFLPDFRELALGTDRLRADTDGDGWNDEIELTTGANPLRFNRLLPGLHSALTTPDLLLRSGDRATASEVSNVLRQERDAAAFSEVQHLLRNGSRNELGLGVYVAEPVVEIRPEGFGPDSAVFEFWPDFNPLATDPEPAALTEPSVPRFGSLSTASDF